MKHLVRHCYKKKSGYVFAKNTVAVTPHKSDAIFESLSRKGIVVHSCRGFAGFYDHYIRASVGEGRENELFVQESNKL